MHARISRQNQLKRKKKWEHLGKLPRNCEISQKRSEMMRRSHKILPLNFTQNYTILATNLNQQKRKSPPQSMQDYNPNQKEKNWIDESSTERATVPLGALRKKSVWFMPPRRFVLLSVLRWLARTANRHPNCFCATIRDPPIYRSMYAARSSFKNCYPQLYHC